MKKPFVRLTVLFALGDVVFAKRGRDASLNIFWRMNMLRKMIFGLTALVLGTLATFSFTACSTVLNNKQPPEKQYYNRGQAAYNMRMWDTAIAEYTKAIDINPRYTDAFHRRGWAYLYSGAVDQAEKDFHEVLRIDPSYIPAKSTLKHYIHIPYAVFLLWDEGNTADRGNFDVVIEKYTQALSLVPDFVPAYDSRGTTYLKKKMYTEAEADFNEALKYDPEDYIAYYQLGIIYKDQEDFDKAEQYMNQALRIYPAYYNAKVVLDELLDFKKPFNGRFGAFDLTTVEGGIVIDKYYGNLDKSKNHEIPRILRGRPVTGIGPHAFVDIFAIYQWQQETVVIPDSVTYIGEGAFSYLKIKLTNVTLPASLKQIGKGAFQGNKLTGIVFPDSLKKIGDNAFSGNELTSITLPAGLTEIGSSAFAYNKLTSVTIPSGVISIGESAFDKNQLTSITLPAGLTEIGRNAFSQNKLTSVTIPSSVISIGEHTFSGNQLTSITIQGKLAMKPNVSYFSGIKSNYYINSVGKPGIYTEQNGTWYYNGQALPGVALLGVSKYIRLEKIDGKSPSSFVHYGETYVLEPGYHDFEVSYHKSVTIGDTLYSTWTDGTVILRYRHLFENKSYTATGEEVGDKIQFSIK